MLHLRSPPSVCAKFSSSRLDFRILPIAYRDFSQNAQNGQNVPQNGVFLEKNTIFKLSQVYTPPWGREGGPNAFFLTPASPKGEEKRTSAHGSKFRWGAGFGIAGSARVGGSARGPDPPGGGVPTLGFGERFF